MRPLQFVLHRRNRLLSPPPALVVGVVTTSGSRPSTNPYRDGWFEATTCIIIVAATNRPMSRLGLFAPRP